MIEWKETVLSDVIELIGGGTPKTSNPEYWNGDIPWLSVVDFNTERKHVYKTEKTITESGLQNSSTKLLKEGDIIISARGTVGAIAVLKTTMAFNQSCYGIRAIPEKTDNDFIYYLTKHSINQLKQIAHGGVFDTITRDTFKAINILLPPLPEQKAIAAVLSSLDDKIDLLYRQNKTLEAMAETLFRQWFIEEADEKWDKVELKSLCVTITKGTTPTSLKKNFTDTGINFIKVNCISENGNFLLDKFNFIDEETNNLLKRSQLAEGDLLYSIAGTIGRTIEVEKNILPANVNQALAIIRVNHDKINSTYIKYCLKDRELIESLHSKIVHAVQPNLSLGAISKIPIIIPEKNCYDLFLLNVLPIEKKLKNNKANIRRLSKIRQTLLPKLISGEIGLKNMD